MKTESVIVIPTYHPDDKLRQFLQNIRKQTPRPIVLVDDGNLDPGQQRFLLSLTNLGWVHLVHHAFHKGRGQALKTAFTYVSQHFPATAGVVTADVAGPYQVADILQLAEALEKESGEIIIGIGENRQLGLTDKLQAVLMELVTGMSNSDKLTGLWALPLTQLPLLLDVTGKAEDYEINMLVTMAKRRVPIKLVPVKVGEAAKQPMLAMPILLKHLFLSSAGVLLDLVLFAIFALLFSPSLLGLILAGVLARLLSGAVHYFLNLRPLFDSQASATSSKRYGYFFAILMVISTLSVAFLSQVTGHHILIKIAIDGLLFLLSYKRLQNNLFQGRLTTCDESDDLAVNHA